VHGDGTNNTVTYSLTDNAGGRFTINANTGVVTVVDGSLLDYETATSYTITVQAGSSDGSIATQTFTIVVSNVNEAPTIVAPVDFDVEFAENSTAVILDLEVEDPEENAINFVLAGADADLFTISDGAIVFNQSPDFEVPRDQGESNV
jgi:Cadherin domain